MKKLNKWLLGTGLFSLVLLLSGCVKIGPDGNPTGKGWVYNFLVKPMSSAMTFFADKLDGNYGLAIILITIIVRLIILPLGLHQSKQAMNQSEKMQFLKPQMDVIQQNIKNATTPEEQRQAQLQMGSFYKENNISMFGGMGCLPLIIQMPIFSALFYAARFTPGINDSTFLGVNLGQRNLLFIALAGLSYLGVSLVSMIGIPEEQKKTMKTMMLMNPLMIVFMSFTSPAGVTLYWIVGGIFAMLQTYISNAIMKPKIRQRIAEEFKNNPPKTVIKPIVRKEVTPPSEKPKPRNNNGKGRNAGKQQHHKK